MAPVLTTVTATVHLVRTDLVNWTIVADGSGVLLIDAGFPGSRDDVLTSLRSLGFTPGDVTAILLTHAHIDHLGAAIWFAGTHATPVYCHPREGGHARRLAGGVPPPRRQNARPQGARGEQRRRRGPPHHRHETP